MRVSFVTGRLGLLAAGFIVAACGSAAPTAGGVKPGGSGGRAWLDAAAPVERRVAALLAEMTLDEKLGQMTQIEIGSIDADGGREGLLGSVLSGGDGNPEAGNTAQNWYDMVGWVQEAALETRLGIPILYGVDAVHGDAHLVGTTVFPHNVGLGATRDADLVEETCRITAAEMNATGVRWTFAPMVTVPQDIRWGRTYEGYGENTELVGRLGTACLEGLQGASLSDPYTVVADPKAFIGDGGTAFGTSEGFNQGRTYLLDQGVDRLANATIETLFLPPFQDAIDNGARIVMASFSGTQDGGKIHGDKHWLTDILKTRLGFTGFVVSDWGGIDQIDYSDYGKAVARAVNAGLDMAMVPYDWRRFESTLKSLVVSGAVPQSRIDDAVTRILRVKFEMGLFENPMPPSGRWAEVGSEASRAVARRAVAESAVLLKTSPGVLPISKASPKVLLAGQGADDIGISSGGWTLSWQGQAGNLTPGTTLRTALAAELGPAITYSAGGDFATGTTAEVGVVVVAERPYAEGIGDTVGLALPTGDVALVAKMRPLVKKLVVVIMSGRPVMTDALAAGGADAVVAAWLPGTQDEGLADVLLGVKPFTGTTPYTWPRTAQDAPRFGKTSCQGAIYPYGYGLDSSGSLLGPAAC